VTEGIEMPKGIYLMNALQERRNELLKRLKDTPRAEWDSVKILFAIEYGLREEKVNEYYLTLRKARLLE
jgi:hypothetical protein